MRYIKIIYFCLTIKNILIFHTYICKNCILHVMALNNMRYVAVPAFIKKKKKRKGLSKSFPYEKIMKFVKYFLHITNYECSNFFFVILIAVLS